MLAVLLDGALEQPGEPTLDEPAGRVLHRLTPGFRVRVRRGVRWPAPASRSRWRAQRRQQRPESEQVGDETSRN
jgi:hypothetical protein